MIILIIFNKELNRLVSSIYSLISYHWRFADCNYIYINITGHVHVIGETFIDLVTEIYLTVNS